MTATLRLTRAAFGAMQRASPDLAARWAARIFCSPPRRAISERMAAWLRDARRFNVTVGKRRVAAWTWGERRLGVAAPVMSSMRERLARRLDFAWDEMDVPAFAPAMRVPLLVIHDREDRDVRWNDGAAIAQAWPGAELVTTSGLGHHRIVSDSGVIRQVVSFLRQTAQ